MSPARRGRPRFPRCRNSRASPAESERPLSSNGHPQSPAEHLCEDDSIGIGEPPHGHAHQVPVVVEQGRRKALRRRPYSSWPRCHGRMSEPARACQPAPQTQLRRQRTYQGKQAGGSMNPYEVLSFVSVGIIAKSALRSSGVGLRCRCTAVGAASPRGCRHIASQCSLRSADTPQIQDIRGPRPPRSAIQLRIKLPCLGDGIGGVLLQVGFDFLNHLIVIHVRHEVIGNISFLLPSLRLFRRNILKPPHSLYTPHKLHR